MKKIILFVIVLLSLFSCKTKIQEFPSRTETTFNFIRDNSKVFIERQIDSLNFKLHEFEQKTTNEIAIVTLDSIQGDIVSFSVKLGDEMGVGKKDKDNGLLILIVKPLRQVRISTGFGTEKILTDSICQNIIDQHMLLEFKKDNFYKGIDDAVDEIIKQWTRE